MEEFTMKHIWIIAVVSLGLTAAASGQILISGPLSGTLAADVYLVTGHLSIVQGDTLIIQPGTTFLFNGDYNFGIGSNRTLICIGTETDRIRFLPNENQGVTEWGHVSFSNTGEEDVFEYCIVRHGTSYNGGGISCSNASPTISHCTISDNSAQYGGGIYCYDNAAPTISYCTISDNSCEWAGGGIYCGYSSPTISQCTIEDNHSVEDIGGGIYCSESSPTISDCTIYDNSALNESGGGIACRSSSHPIIERCTIEGNSAEIDGGAIYCYSSSPTISDCTIEDNSADTHGGGICCAGYSHPQISNCTIKRNRFVEEGGGIYCASSSTTISNCIIEENTAQQGGAIYLGGSDSRINYCIISSNSTFSNNAGAIYCTFSNPIITFCTILGNSNTYDDGGAIFCSSAGAEITNCTITGNSGEGLYVIDDRNPGAAYCDIYNNSNGAFGGPDINPDLGVIVSNNANGDPSDAFENIFLDPLFLDPDNGNVHLQEDSPCIDAGDPDSPLDPDSTIADIGAFYFHQENVGVKERSQAHLARNWSVLPAYPNPFNASTTIRVSLPDFAELEVTVYNVNGRLIADLAHETGQPGVHHYSFNASNLASGLYFIRVNAGDQLDHVQKVILVR
jgi:parallel beta-helix repeat protein/predicted outer membrane repeat protein